MAINRIQMQKGLSLSEFQARYGSEAQCLASLEAARWPEGFVCPDCGGRVHTVFERRNHRWWQCSTCRHQATVTAGTMMDHSKLPLRTWFLAIYLVTQAKNAISSLELMRHMGVCYKTA